MMRIGFKYIVAGAIFSGVLTAGLPAHAEIRKVYSPPSFKEHSAHWRHKIVLPQNENKLAPPRTVPISFVGTHVYTVDANGKTIPMPDGIYHTPSGHTLIVLAGHRSGVSN